MVGYGTFFCGCPSSNFPAKYNKVLINMAGNTHVHDVRAISFEKRREGFGATAMTWFAPFYVRHVRAIFTYRSSPLFALRTGFAHRQRATHTTSKETKSKKKQKEARRRDGRRKIMITDQATTGYHTDSDGPRSTYVLTLTLCYCI